MTDKSLYYKVMLHDKIYSLMYCPYRIPSEPLEEQIREISVKSIKWSEDRTEFYYLWGMPGPDYNTYDATTYGRGWGFTKQKIIDSWKEQQHEQSRTKSPQED